MSARHTAPLAPSWAPLVTAAAVLLIGTISALVWHSHRLPSADAWAMRALEARNNWTYWTARAFSFSLVTMAIGGTLAVAVLAWVVLRWRDAGLLTLMAPVLAFAAEWSLKHLVARRAPGSTVFHYPSGHVAVTTASALGILLVVRAARAGPGTRSVAIAACLWVVATALARLVDQAHLLSDVVGGLATGVAATLTVALLLDHDLPHPRDDQPYEETNR